MLTGLRTSTDSLPEGDIHDILRNERRRNVIKHLRERGHEVALRNLADRLAELETGESPPPSNIRDSVYISLHQTHLPKLDDAGVIEYDKDRKTIRLQNPVRRVNLYMEVVTKYGITWMEYYRLVATIGLVTVVAADVGFPVVGMVDSLLWTSLFLVVIALSTLYQVWSNRWLYLRQLA